MAAGKGTRLKSKHPKVLHEIGGKPLLRYVIETAARSFPRAMSTPSSDTKPSACAPRLADTGCSFIVQEQQRGTGHAIMAGATRSRKLRSRPRALRRHAADSWRDHRDVCATSTLRRNRR